MKKERKVFNLSTVIYLTVLGVLLIQQFLVNNGLNVQSFIGIVLLTTIPYIFLTKRYYYLIPFVSVFFVLMVIGSMPIAVYEITGKEPGFIIASSTLGFFITLLVGTIVSKAQWSIKSPWVANILGTTSLFIVQYLLLTATTTESQVLIGTAGLAAHLLTSLSYLMVGPSVKVNNPSPLRDQSVADRLLDFLADNGYSYVSYPKQPQRRDTLLDNNSKYDDSFRFIFSETAISLNNEKKGIKKFQFYKDGSSKNAYSWLLRESIKSKEAPRTNEVKNEHLIFVYFDDTSKISAYDTLELPIKRSSKTLNVGVLKLGKNINKETLTVVNNLLIDVSLKNNENH